MRINAGRHRGAKLVAPKGHELRPTSDRARQAIFNMLSHGQAAIPGARVLDAFAGSGALGLEALSRGAQSLIAFDTDKAAIAAIRRNVAHCREDERTRVIEADATHPPQASRFADGAPCTLVFLDPPYGRGLVAAALTSLAKARWIAPSALIVAEMGVGDGFLPPDGFAIHDERRYGKARIVFLTASPRG